MINTNSKRLFLKLLVVLTTGFGFLSSTAVASTDKAMTFNFVNGTKGLKADKDIYWSIIGKDWDSKEFVYFDLNSGKLMPMKLDHNGALIKNGVGYSDYFYSLAQAKSVQLPIIDSARILFSVGDKMYIQINEDVNGKVAYAGANIENPTDANLDVHFDFIEMAIIPEGAIYINTTRVDHFGFPLQLRLQDANGYDKVVGERVDTESRATLFAKFKQETPKEFHNLIQTHPVTNEEMRIIAPAHGSFGHGDNADYLKDYIQTIWDKYKREDLVFSNSIGVTYTGRVDSDGQFIFRETFVPKDKEHEKRPEGETYRIKAMPKTAEVLLGNGVLDDASGTGDCEGKTGADMEQCGKTKGERIKRQLHIQAQLCAALTRHVAETPDKWKEHSEYYPQGQPSNSYSKFWHDQNIDKLSYGFAYDDVWDASASLHSTKPTTATVTIGW